MSKEKRSLSARWIEGKTGYGGSVLKKTDGIIEVIPVYDKMTVEEEEALAEVTDNLEGYVEETGIRERGQETVKTAGAVKNSNSILNSIIVKVVERPEVREKLDTVKEEMGYDWYTDLDWVGVIARLIMKNYPQFNFTENQIVEAIKELYG